MLAINAYVNHRNVQGRHVYQIRHTTFTLYAHWLPAATASGGVITKKFTEELDITIHVQSELYVPMSYIHFICHRNAVHILIALQYNTVHNNFIHFKT